MQKSHVIVSQYLVISHACHHISCRYVYRLSEYVTSMWPWLATSYLTQKLCQGSMIEEKALKALPRALGLANHSSRVTHRQACHVMEAAINACILMKNSFSKMKQRQRKAKGLNLCVYLCSKGLNFGAWQFSQLARPLRSLSFVSVLKIQIHQVKAV